MDTCELWYERHNKRISTITLFDVLVADIAWPGLGAWVQSIYEAVGSFYLQHISTEASGHHFRTCPVNYD